MPEAATGGRFCLARWASINVPLDVVHRHRVGREEDGVVLPGPLAVFARERPALVDAADAVHDLEDELLADDRVADHLGDELVADVGEVVAVRAGHVVDRAVAHVLEGAGHAGRAVVLEDRDRHDLVDRLGHQLAEMRAVLAVVLGVVAVGDQVHPDERVVVEAGDRIACGMRGNRAVNWFALRVEPAPADVRRGGSCDSRRP